MMSSDPSMNCDDKSTTLTPVVNAAGKMTYLGGTTCTEGVIAAMGTAARSWYDMDQLLDSLGHLIADVTDAEAGMVANCAAGGLALAAAACTTGTDSWLIHQLPAVPEGVCSRIVLPAVFAVDFGASLRQMLALGGAQLDLIGDANRCAKGLLAAALDRPAVAAMHVVSHHVQAEQVPDLDDMIRIAHTREIPVVVDAAAETDLVSYIRAGVDLVIYSGQKSVGAPTSALVAGRSDLVQACRAQSAGIGRAMKVSKETAYGLWQALDEYVFTDEHCTTIGWNDLLSRTAAELADLPGISTVGAVEAERGIPRLRVDVDPVEAGMDAAHLAHRLASHRPSVRLRTHHASYGWLQIDPRPMSETDPQVIGQAFRACLTSVSSSKAKR